MQTTKFDNTEDWLKGRVGKITGKRAGKIANESGPSKESLQKELDYLKIEYKKTSKKEELQALLPQSSIEKLERDCPKKIGFYELIAEKLGVPADDESDMDRGHRLESEAIEVFKEKTGKKVNTDLVIWSRDDNENIAISPDGFMGLTEAVEVKCLSSARHIEAWLTQKIPDEHWYQVLQYFVTNDKLKKLYFVFYDPRILAKPFFYLEVDRKDIQAEVTMLLEYEKRTLKEVEEIVNELTF